MNKNTQSMLYAAANALIVALAVGLKDGSVPLPQGAIWIAPLLVAILTAISPYVAFGAKDPAE